jgi:hypothetical protein
MLAARENIEGMSCVDLPALYLYLTLQYPRQQKLGIISSSGCPLRQMLCQLPWTLIQ